MIGRRDRATTPAGAGKAVLVAAAVVLTLPAAADGQRLRVTSSLPAEGFVDRDVPVEIRFDRALAEGEQVALWIGDQDVTGLVRRSERGLRYEPGVLPLPSGSSELRVFLVSEGRWEEVATFPLRVRGALGFESNVWEPRLSLGLDGQVAEGHTPAEEGPPRDTYEDLEGELTLRTEHVHRSFALEGSAKVLGASYRKKALRFGERGDDAPLVDLAEFGLTVRGGPGALEVGHIATGDHRHLIRNFGSRGARVSLDAGSRVSLSGAVTGGSRVVGWDDPFGATDPDHRVWNASVGVEAAPTPGALRFDVTLLDGSVLPRSGFNRGAVVDAETSRGIGVRVRGRALDRRLSFDAGFARSSFDNPLDQALQGSQGAPVEVRPETAGARYLDASVDVLRGLSVGDRTVGLSVGFSHERVDPLYRSVGVRTRADYLQNQLDVRADVAGVALQGTFGSGEDNLGRLSSVLTSHTDRMGLDVGLPVAQVVGTGSPWLPRIRLRVDRTHQFGEGIPENGGFNASHVPDQLSTRRAATVDWRWRKVTVGYRWDASHQDNRQEGREDADLQGSQHGFGVTLTPVAPLRISLDAALERAENLERDEVDDTRKLGARLRWSPFDRSTLSVRWAWTATEDRADTRERASRTLDAQLSSAVPGLDGVDGQAFLRLSQRVSERVDAAFDTDQRRENWTLSTGMSVTLQNR